jgi:CheY-like chemotaxis protein
MTDSSRSMPAVGPNARAKILIVDDTPSNRVAFTSILEGPRHEILQARDGLEALELVIDHDFAVILLDIRMPRMGGLEAAQNIRARKRSRYTPIIFLSAYESTPVEVSKGYVIGGVIDYLFSPVDPDMLRSKVSFLADLYLRSRESQKEVQDLRDRCQAHELRIQELQSLIPPTSVDPQSR